MRIAILWHESDRPSRLLQYLVADFCRAWEVAGHDVVHVQGPARFQPADVALLHVDLSMVPEPYVALSRRYPRSLNDGILDIRKRRVSQALLLPGDDEDRPVIVKTDLNHGGEPERCRQSFLRSLPWRVVQRIRRGVREVEPRDYPVFDTLGDVPASLRRDPGLVIEKFLPEREGSSYFLRQSYFLGDASVSWRLRSIAPVIRGEFVLDDVEIPTPPSIDDFRRTIGLDYGKVDYVEHQGRTIVLDVNKTIGGRGTAPLTVARLASAIDAAARADRR